MNKKHVLKQVNLLFVDDDINASADAFALFSPIFRSVTLAHDAHKAMAVIETGSIDLIMTDIEMPKEDGLTFVSKVRALSPEFPIIVISAYSENSYLYKAANLRIDGYLIKPLSFKKLDPVLTIIAQRLEKKFTSVFIADDIYYQPSTGIVSVNKQQIRLGKKEFSLLRLLISNSDNVISKDTIKKAIWPEIEASDSAFKNLMSELRKKLVYDVIRNIPGQGWQLPIDYD
tara:strand:+ start:79422 stop:80111 length:690 start_codon:yes stop_codon:yes gene_type:complete